RKEAVKIVQKPRCRPFPITSYDAGYRRQAATAEGVEQFRGSVLALSAQYTIERIAVFQQISRHKRGAVTTAENQTILQEGAGTSRQFEHFRHVSQVIERKTERMWTPAFEQAVKITMGEDLEVENLNLMARCSHRSRDSLHAQWFEPQVDFAVHQRTRMDEKNPHSC